MCHLCNNVSIDPFIIFNPYFQPTVNQTHFDLHRFTTKPYMFTNFIFSGESICGDKLCEKLFEVFSDPLASKIFRLDIPSPDKLPVHQNVQKHVHPGRTEQEIKERLYKSMFDLRYKNGATLHHIITKATEPVNSRKEPLSHYLCHSIHIAEIRDYWSFNFKHPGFPQEHTRTFGVGEVKLPGGAVYRQKEILMFFYIMQFTGMYPDGDLYNRRSERVGTFNAVWNEEFFKNKHKGKEEHIWVQACNDSYHADQANINNVIKNWIRKKEERESSEDPSRGAWEEAFDYFIQQLKRNRTCERSEETSSSQESEYSEQDPGEEEEWQEQDEEVDAEEETWKSDSRCHKQEKEKLDGGGDRCRQQQERRRNKSNRRAEPEGNMDEPVRKCFKASEDMQ